MATTAQALKSYYSNVMRADFAHIPAAHQTLLTTLSSQVDGGTLSLADARTQIVKLAIATTSVASVSYSFFAGGVPSSGGLNYLVSANWDNPTSLNSAFYQSFSIENRYINFSVNLGKFGEGRAWFETNYGALSLSEALVKAYTTLFGVPPDAAKVDVLLNGQVPNGAGGTYTRAEYLASYGGDGANGLGTKAAMVGWLMAEAMKADTGVYAKANAAFLADLGDDGIAAFRSDLVGAYGAAPAATPGATLNAPADKSISPTAVDPTLKSTNGDDVISAFDGLNGGQSINAGAGRDRISIVGTFYGQVTTADGHDTVTLGALGAAGGQAASVILAGDQNVVTLKGGMAAGTRLTATGSGEVLHIDGGATATYEGVVSGFQTVYYHSSRGPAVTGASVIYSVVNDPTDTNPLSFTLLNHETLVLKDTPNGVTAYIPAAPDTGAKLEIHLQNFMGAPTTKDSGFVSPGGVINNPVYDGGAIGFYVQANGRSDENGTLLLHVDTDSTAGLIYGWATNLALGPNYRGSAPNLVISGPGKLTAQISNTFKNVDARDAGDLNLSYWIDVGVGDQIFRLGDGTNTLKLVFANAVVSNWAASTSGAHKVYLGAGVDTIIAGGALLSSNPAMTSLANLYVKDGVVAAPPEIIGFQKNVDHLVLDQLAHAVTTGVQAYANGKATLFDALTAVSAQVAAGSIAVFTWNGDTYIYSQDSVAGLNTGQSGAPGDGLIKLVGVTGLTVGTGVGSYDIHYG